MHSCFPIDSITLSDVLVLLPIKNEADVPASFFIISACIYFVKSSGWKEKGKSSSTVTVLVSLFIFVK